MSVLIVAAGILAALVLFRWARTLASLALVFTVVWFWVHFARWEAQQPPGPVAAELMR